MTPDARPVELYDFLYRDASRLASYYAQLFGGRLNLTEESEGTQKASDYSTEGSVGVAKVGAKTTKTDNASLKKIVDPHDIIVLDVLTARSTQCPPLRAT